MPLAIITSLEYLPKLKKEPVNCGTRGYLRLDKGSYG